MANYLVQDSKAVLGTSASVKTLAATYSSANSAVIQSGKAEKILLLISYTMGASETSNSIEVKVEFSDAVAGTYRRQTGEAYSSGTTTLVPNEYSFAAVSAAATYDHFAIELDNVGAEYVKVSVKETGKATNFGTCYIYATVSGR